MLQIRTAATEDIDLIRELTMQVWPQTYTPILGEVQVKYMLDKFYHPAELTRQMNGGFTFLICYSAGQPAAFAAYEALEDGIVKLHKIYILPTHQGKGIGRFLISHISAAVAAGNATVLRLNVNRYNYSAIRFYEKMGFRNAGDEDIDIGGGYFMNDHILDLQLPSGL